MTTGLGPRANDTNLRITTLAAEATLDIAAWLRGLGLEQYAPVVRNNGIDMQVLWLLLFRRRNGWSGRTK
jgi:hypothetical protein